MCKHLMPHFFTCIRCSKSKKPRLKLFLNPWHSLFPLFNRANFSNPKINAFSTTQCRALEFISFQAYREEDIHFKLRMQLKPIVSRYLPSFFVVSIKTQSIDISPANGGTFRLDPIYIFNSSVRCFYCWDLVDSNFC